MPEEKPVYKVIIAGNYRQFELWCRKYEFNPKGPDIRYAMDLCHIRGYGPGTKYFFVGDYYKDRVKRDLAEEVRGRVKSLGLLPEDHIFYEDNF